MNIIDVFFFLDWSKEIKVGKCNKNPFQKKIFFEFLQKSSKHDAGGINRRRIKLQEWPINAIFPENEYSQSYNSSETRFFHTKKIFFLILIQTKKRRGGSTQNLIPGRIKTDAFQK